MGTNSGPWGWWVLLAALNLASVHSFDAPTSTQRGCMWAGMAFSKAERAAGEAGPVAWSAGLETSGPVDSQGGGWVVVVLGAWWGFLEGGWDGRRWECDATPLRSLYRPYASDPATASLIFPHPFISNCWALSSSLHASSLSELALCSKSNPWKGQDRIQGL